MLRYCSTITLASLSVASTKVALSLQGLSLANSRRKSIFSGNVLVLCKRSSTSPEMVTLSRVLLHSLHITSPVVSVCVSWQSKQPRIGDNYLQSSNFPQHCMCWAFKHVKAWLISIKDHRKDKTFLICFQPLRHQKYPSKIRLLSSFLAEVSFPC